MPTALEQPPLSHEPTDIWTWDRNFDCPEEITEVMKPMLPGVSHNATRARGFKARIRAWRLGAESFVEYAASNGSATFDEGRSWGTVTIPLYESIDASVGTRQFYLDEGEFQVIAPGVRGDLKPGDRSQVLGFSVDWGRFAEHLRAVAGEGNVVNPVPYSPLSAQTEQGRQFLAHFNRLCRELSQRGSQLGSKRVALEAVDTLQRLLAEALCATLDFRPEQSDKIVVKLVRDFLAESLETPVSLSDASLKAGTSTRSLLRSFQRTYGLSPMAFRRRLRFEAARHDLFIADRDETSVTAVAQRYCFDHLGRFSVEYRKLFGESPSQTLRG